MFDFYSAQARTEKLIGKENLIKLQNSRVAVFGIGGVGSYAAEAVARAGVGEITLVDNDVVALSNLNRQLVALNSTLGKNKTSVMKDRILDINPNATVIEKPVFFSEETMREFDFSSYDCVLDCIDSVNEKILLITCAKGANTKIISCMGTGNKLDPTQFELTDIYKTNYCPLARKVRTMLKKQGIDSLMVVYSKEEPVQTQGAPASISFVPSVAGLTMASWVIKELIK